MHLIFVRKLGETQDLHGKINFNIRSYLPGLQTSICKDTIEFTFCYIFFCTNSNLVIAQGWHEKVCFGNLGLVCQGWGLNKCNGEVMSITQ